jgi:NSS family neurotransmitter:Na+ symporter
MCSCAGWLWQRNTLLQELQKNDGAAEHRLFWRVWPAYVKWFCPVIIGLILLQSVV